MSDQLKRRNRNCDSRSNKRLYMEGLGMIDRCPWSLPVEAWQMMTAYQDWEIFGVLPFGSSHINDEPAQVLQAFRQISQSKNEMEVKQMQKHQNSGAKHGFGSNLPIVKE